MQDNTLITDLLETHLPTEKVNQLVAAEIQTYTGLFALLRNNKADTNLRRTGVHAIGALWRTIDKRRAGPALRAALHADDNDLRRAAANVLGALGFKGAEKPLLAILTDKQADEALRVAIAPYTHNFTSAAFAAGVRAVILDESDSVRVRAMLIEHAAHKLGDERVMILTDLLAHPSAEIRFWTAFALAGSTDMDITPARAALDRVAAFDHVIPPNWGWHVDREALYPLTWLDYQPYVQPRPDKDGAPAAVPYGFWLLSPAPEYANLMYGYVQNSPPLTPPPVTLNLSASWLRTELEAAWPEITFDVHPARTQTFKLGWLLPGSGTPLLGGLHRDGYAVTLMGNENDVRRFALWYREVVPAATLYLYRWAEPGVRVERGMSLAALQVAMPGNIHDLQAEAAAQVGTGAVNATNPT